MLHGNGERYREYMQRTGSVFPRLRRARASAQRAAGWVHLGLYAIVLAVSLAGTFALRNYTLGQLSAVYGERMAVLSPGPSVRADG